MFRFFKELEERHQQNIVIDDISDIVYRHAQSNFDPYITYCSNEVYQQRTLQRLVWVTEKKHAQKITHYCFGLSSLNTQSPSALSFRSKNPAFKEVLTRIEGHPDCRNLPMISFLILPMQRITRLPLLMDVSALLRLHSSTSSRITWLSLRYATLCLSVLPWLILHGLCSNFGAVCTTFSSVLDYLNWFSSSDSLQVFFFLFLSGFMLPSAPHYSPSLPLPCSTFILLSAVFCQCLPGDSGVYACTLRGFWILRKFGFRSLLPTAFFKASIFYPTSERTWGPVNCYWGFARKCVFVWDVSTICYWLSLWLPFCCRQSVRRRPKTQHNMKTVRGLCKESARCVRWGTRPEMTHSLDYMFS